MMIGMITSQVFHHKVDPETLLMQVRRSVRLAVGILILLRMSSLTPATPQ
jgi:hypothetical protein